MTYIRKTEDEYRIMGLYQCGWEEVTCEMNYRDAREQLKTYRENEPGTAFHIKRVRVPITQPTTKG